MLSRVFGENIRIWKDLLRVICNSGDVEYYDFGDTLSVLGVNFRYSVDTLDLVLTGEVVETIRCRTVMELVTAILTVVSFLFRNNDLDINPILGDQALEESELDFDELEDTMDMGSEIDGMGGDDFDMGGGEDLAGEFEPSEESMLNTAPGIEEGKTEVLDEIYEE
jgi:hypothetical protein